MQTLGTFSVKRSRTSFDVNSKIFVLKRNPNLQCKQDYQKVGRKMTGLRTNGREKIQCLFNELCAKAPNVLDTPWQAYQSFVFFSCSTGFQLLPLLNSFLQAAAMNTKSTSLLLRGCFLSLSLMNCLQIFPLCLLLNSFRDLPKDSSGTPSPFMPNSQQQQAYSSCFFST